MKIAIGNDHAGVDLKNKIINHLTALGHQIANFGTDTAERTDYPLYAEKVAQTVLSEKAVRGILICGSGVGMCISANKFHGIRAVVCSEPYSAVMSRRHNNSNVLCLGARVVGPELAREIVTAFLGARFTGNDPGGERHARRVAKIRKLEAS